MKFKVITFKCNSCGGTLRFNPATSSLKCDFCGGIEKIEAERGEVKSLPLHDGLRVIDRDIKDNREVKCIRCGADFVIDYDTVSSNCPYCSTPAITEFIKPIEPNGMLPFKIEQKEAQKRFKNWIGSLWFAPSRLKEFVDGNRKLTPYYIPYWAFDIDTYTRYSGERGDIYFVTVEKRVIINGKEQIVLEQEARVKWTPVNGDVLNSFRNLEVGATKSLPIDLLESLSPWNIDNLVPFNLKSILGFMAKEYTIPLSDGFNRAKIRIEKVVNRTIRKDIGGDHQRIHYKNIIYRDEKYKNILLPIYTAKFRWKNQTYTYIINGESGKVVGERPYSVFKITTLILSIITILGVIIYMDSHR